MNFVKFVFWTLVVMITLGLIGANLIGTAIDKWKVTQVEDKQLALVDKSLTIIQEQNRTMAKVIDSQINLNQALAWKANAEGFAIALGVFICGCLFVIVLVLVRLVFKSYTNKAPSGELQNIPVEIRRLEDGGIVGFWPDGSIEIIQPSQLARYTKQRGY